MLNRDAKVTATALVLSLSEGVSGWVVSVFPVKQQGKSSAGGEVCWEGRSEYSHRWVKIVTLYYHEARQLEKWSRTIPHCWGPRVLEMSSCLWEIGSHFLI